MSLLKNNLSVLLGFILLLSSPPTLASKNLYDFQIKSAQGDVINFNDFKGAPLLVVNIATRCGYTDQLDGLEKLYQKYKDRGLNVLGVPSNDFANQTPEEDEEVAKFCRLEYGVSFPLTQRIHVKGDDQHPLIKSILKDKEEIEWNFEKFILDKNANLKYRFKSDIRPLSEKIQKAIDSVI